MKQASDEETDIGRVQLRLTVLFEDPFWIGVFELIEEGRLTVAKHTFGAEPSIVDLHTFILWHYRNLEFSPPVEVEIKKKHVNPKRQLREARKMTASQGVGTKSQQALQMLREEKKTERKQLTKEQKEYEKQRRFELKQLKKRAKHKGR